MNATKRQHDFPPPSASRFPPAGAAGDRSGAARGLDLGRLEKVRTVTGKTIARCPVCAESGGDESGEHLFVDAQGRFGCVAHPGPEGAEHRRRIFALCGIVEKSSPAPRTAARTSKPARTWATPEDAAKDCTPQGYTLAACYHYPRDGKPFAAVGRYEGGDGKTFRQFSMNGDGWKAGGPSDKWPLYGVEALPAEGPLYVCEGEKAHAAAVSIGLPCVTSAGGSGAAAKTDWTPLSGRNVVILPDNDDPGESYARDVAAILGKLDPPARVRIVRLPITEPGADIVDWIEAHGDAAEPETLCAEIEGLAAKVELTTAANATAPTDPVEAARAGQPYAMTDLGNAERLVAYHGDAIRWDTARKVWRAWDGRRWAVDAALQVNTLAADTARKIRQEAAAAPKGEGKRDLGMELFSWAVRSESRDRLAAMIEVAKARPGIAVASGALDLDPWALNVLNGTIDLKTGTLRPHNRADLLTKLAPVEYRPGHRDERLERFLADATGGDAEVVAFLQRVTGYTFTGLTVEEILLLIFGPEAAGKSTFLDMLRAAMGDYARTIAADLLTRQRESRGGGAASPELAGLAGARLAAGSEMEQGREIAEALAKNLTGGEPITARHLYAELFDFRPQFKLWLALNHCPKVSADDGAIWRRILRIGFEHTVPPERRDKTLKPYLRDPNGGAPAVLAWAVEGCLRWQREGLQIPDAVKRSTAAYRQESDPLAAFIEDCLRFTPAAWTPWGEIWTAYNEHCTENGTGERYRVAPKRLQERLRAHDCQSERRFIGRGWAGVEIQDGWKLGDHDAHVGYDATLQKSFSASPIVKVLDKATYPTLPTCPPVPDPAELDLADARYLAEERAAIQAEDAQ